MIYFQTGILICLLLLFYWINKGDAFSPSFIFTASFTFSSLWACIYANKWNLELHQNTFNVICGGVLEFGIVCLIVHTTSTLFKKNRASYWKRFYVSPIFIQRGKLYFFMAFEVLTILLTVRFLGRATGSTNLTNAIFMYRYQFDELTGNTGMPFYVSWPRICVNAAGYWFAYIFANNFVATKKLPKLELIIVLLSAVSGMMLGGRGNIVFLLLAIAVLYWILFHKTKSPKESKVSFKALLITVAIAAVLIITFQNLGNLLGRNSTANPMDYLATYFGAEIKNLDMVLQGNAHYSVKFFGEQTFINLYKWIGSITNNSEMLDLNFATQFLSINGYNLGNVYTTFYSFYHDMGYPGIIIFVFVMALICQSIYEHILSSEDSRRCMTLMVLFGYIFNTIVFSFFSNKFYEQLFSGAAFYSIIFWLLFRFFFIKVKFKVSRK